MNKEIENISFDARVELSANEQKLLADTFGAIYASPSKIEEIIKQAPKSKRNE